MSEPATSTTTSIADQAIPAFVNTSAGHADDAVEALRKLGTFEVCVTDPRELADRVRDAVERGARRVAVAGGDGSVACAAQAIIGTGTELAVLPGGTLNHFVKDHAIPDEVEAAARIAASGTTQPVDVAFVCDRLFINTSSVGAYATFVRVRDRLERSLGYWLASAVAAARILLRLRTFRVTLEVDGVTREYVTPLVFIGLGERELKLPTLGARVEGGHRGLHVMVVRSRTGARIVALAMAAVARGVRAVARTPAIDAFVVDRCRIDAPFRTIAVDGELVTLTAPFEYRIVRDAIAVVVPPAGSAAPVA